MTIFLAGLGFAQTKTRRTIKKPTQQTVKPTPSPTQTNKTVQESSVKTVTKKNERPANEISTNQTTLSNSNKTADPVYVYEFTQPSFLVSKIYIEHDEQGKGKITFEKRDFGEAVTDPLQLSQTTLEKLKNAFDALDFINSTESYQYEKDYSHLGNIRIKVKKDGRERTAEFNWTDNKQARVLMDEYRKIAQQFVWIFDINVSRQNQPLNAPSLMDTLDGYIRRNEISDPPQMIPFLTELSNDERIPLIARNHAMKLIKQIEKEIKK
ncbi:hypothetical protein BH10ACI1_BH10ACI1_13230 [soil metagenome]